MHVWIMSFNTGIIFHLFQEKTTFFSQQPFPFSQQDVDMVIEAVPEIMDLKKWLGSGWKQPGQ